MPNRRKKYANTISFLWQPAGYPVRWADSPDEVPPWDITRGFSITAGFHGYKARRNIGSYSIEELRKFLYYDPGDVDGPSFDKAYSWEPSSAPTEGYPRLVRRDCEDSASEIYRHEENVLGDLAPFGSDLYLDSWRAGNPAKILRRKIAFLAEKYGAPYRRDGNTLFAWLALLTYVNIHLTAAGALGNDLYGYEGMLLTLMNRYVKVRRRMAVGGANKLQGYAYPSLHHFTVESMNNGEVFRTDWQRLGPYRAQIHKDIQQIYKPIDGLVLFDTDQVELIQLGILLDKAFSVKEVVKSGASREEQDGAHSVNDLTEKQSLNRSMASNFRKSQGDRHFEWFSDSTQNTTGSDYRLTLTSDGLALECPIGLWVELKLSEVWRNSLPLRECEQCGTIFAPLTQGRKYCDRGGCADKSYQVRKKERSSS